MCSVPQQWAREEPAGKHSHQWHSMHPGWFLKDASPKPNEDWWKIWGPKPHRKPDPDAHRKHTLPDTLRLTQPCRTIWSSLICWPTWLWPTHPWLCVSYAHVFFEMCALQVWSLKWKGVLVAQIEFRDISQRGTEEMVCVCVLLSKLCMYINVASTPGRRSKLDQQLLQDLSDGSKLGSVCDVFTS